MPIPPGKPFVTNHKTGLSQPVAGLCFPETQQTQLWRGSRPQGQERARNRAQSSEQNPLFSSAGLLALNLHSQLWLSSTCVRSDSTAVTVCPGAQPPPEGAGSRLWSGASDSGALEREEQALLVRQDGTLGA